MTGMAKKRCFEVETPLGRLKVYAKQENDVPEDYPGVYVDLLGKDSDEAILLTCVEYNSAKQVLQTCVYGDGLVDTPTDVIEHQNLTFEEESL